MCIRDRHHIRAGNAERLLLDDHAQALCNTGRHFRRSIGPVSYTHLDVYKRQDVRWVDIFDHKGIEMPDITVLILEELQKSIQEDKSLPFGRAVPLYRNQRGRFLRDLL